MTHATPEDQRIEDEEDSDEIAYAWDFALQDETIPVDDDEEGDDE